MSDDDRLDFLSAFGDEFCDALSPAVGRGDLVPQDGFEVFLRVFRREPSPRLLSSLTDGDVERLRLESERHLECEGITPEQIRTAISRTLARWPADG
jgi:hypothetical protein